MLNNSYRLPDVIIHNVLQAIFAIFVHRIGGDCDNILLAVFNTHFPHSYALKNDRAVLEPLRRNPLHSDGSPAFPITRESPRNCPYHLHKAIHAEESFQRMRRLSFRLSLTAGQKVIACVPNDQSVAIEP